MLRRALDVLGMLRLATGGERRSILNATAYPLDPANAAQASEWNGEDGRYWASHHEVYERMLGVFDVVLVEAVDVGAKDRCLDIGCGTGRTSVALANRASRGSVLGLDISAPLLTIARETTERVGDQKRDIHPGRRTGVPVEGCLF
jgi:SAM-dependent methyltransferase